MSSDENQERKLSEEDAGERLTKCLLAQWRLCTAGALLGAAYGIKKSKGAIPMVIGGVVGTVADFAYGFSVDCQEDAQQWLKERYSEERE